MAGRRREKAARASHAVSVNRRRRGADASSLRESCPMPFPNPPHRRRLLQAFAAGIGAEALSGAAALAQTPPTDWHALAADVKAEMAWAWANYKERAWGHDQIKPVSGGSEEFFFPKGGEHNSGEARAMGLSIVEALDTLWVMGLDAEFEDGVNWCVKPTCASTSTARCRCSRPRSGSSGGLLLRPPRLRRQAPAGPGAGPDRAPPARLHPVAHRDAVPLRQPEDRRGARSRKLPGGGRQLHARMGHAVEADRRQAILRHTQRRRPRPCSTAARRSTSSPTRSTCAPANGSPARPPSARRRTAITNTSGTPGSCSATPTTSAGTTSAPPPSSSTARTRVGRPPLVPRASTTRPARS